MGEVKSAREIALEKAAQIGEATEDERLAWRYLPEGEKLAGLFIRGEGDITASLDKAPVEARGFIKKAARDIFLRNIDLPRSEVARKNCERAIEGIKQIVADKAAAAKAFSKITSLFEHFEQNAEKQKSQAYEQLRSDFAARLEQMIAQQYGAGAKANVDVESQPKFQEEWRQLQSRLDAQYLQHLDEYKRELAQIE